MKTEDIIELKNIHKTFYVKNQAIAVLKKINLEIRDKDFTIIWGPSGCGKSTLLHVMLGLEIPTKGSIDFFGHNLYNQNEDKRSDLRKTNVGIIYQQQNWIKSLTVLENVAFPLSLLGEEKQRSLGKARAILSTVGMLEWSNYFPTELSSGQQQKVALARALITDPKIIVADEPTGNLDYKSGIELMQLFTKLNNEGKTVLLVTHDLNNIDYAKRIIQMLDGQIINSIDMSKKDVNQLKKEFIEQATMAKMNGITRKYRNTEITVGEVNTESKLDKLKKRSLSFIRDFIKIFFANVSRSIKFIGLLFSYALSSLFYLILKKKILPHSVVKILLPIMAKTYKKLMNVFERKDKNTIKIIDLINISIRNLLVKKSRSIITIGGVMIGIGVIVFLVSLGYGLEQLVISRTATLNEMKQIDAQPAVASNIVVDNEMISNLKEIDSVEQVLPLISIAGRIEYNDSITDVVVYGVSSEYLNISSIKPVQGRIFEDDGFNGNGQNQAVVNTAFLNIFGIGDAIDKDFNVNFIATDKLTNDKEKVESESYNYRIEGVIENADSPVLYISIDDLEKIGIDYFTEVKIVISDQSKLDTVRSKVEVMGLKTTSIVDTVSQIENMFSTFRFFLWIIGLFALAVATLGMVNTLIVSLLERTREVGLMKILGMKSDEVQELFLTESLTLGFLGGVSGLVMGTILGQILSLLLSVVAVSRGYGFVSVSHVPFIFAIVIIFVSILVGILTGVYPAKRSSEISALDALRYE